ncbi:glutamate racemase [Acutalibacter caecimuris]|uniref:glutamate racemase n=1 Tax=Acutalibacter caecimuris TaxID=3093657 RepID=UPI002AC9E518|nr:glutamate racemase [Acutalibacter sp. M00118]
MDNRPIGVFDSGLGGLTAVKELEKVLPGESIVYFGDTGRVPYGTRSRETVRRYARQDMAFLTRHDVKAVLAACGTVSSTAGDIGHALPVPYFDVVGPTAQAAVRAAKGGKIGVIGTSATVHSGSYARAIAALDPALQVFTQPCPLFVPLVENGFVAPGEEITRLAAEHYLAPLREAGVSVLILGCTHYPLIAPTICQVMGPQVTLVDSGREAALALAGYLTGHTMLCGPGQPRQAEYYVTDEPENFAAVAALFLGHAVKGPRRVDDIESY